MNHLQAEINVVSPQISDHECFSKSVKKTNVIIACFLVREGADIHIENKQRRTPINLCSTDIAALIITNFVVGKHGR